MFAPDLLMAAALLFLGYRTAKTLHIPVTVAIDRLEALSHAAVSDSGRPPRSRRRQTMSSEQATRAQATAEASTVFLLKVWALFGILSTTTTLGFPYSGSLRRLLIFLAILRLPIINAFIDASFKTVGGCLLGKIVPTMLRWGKRQARGALWWVSPGVRHVVSGLTAPSALGLAATDDLIALQTAARVCLDEMEKHRASQGSSHRLSRTNRPSSLAPVVVALDASDDDDAWGNEGDQINDRDTGSLITGFGFRSRVSGVFTAGGRGLFPTLTGR